MAARSRRLWYLWYTKIFPLLSASAFALLLRLSGFDTLLKVWAVLGIYFFVYRKLPYRMFKGEGGWGRLLGVKRATGHTHAS